jgi:hypothetical protein
MNRHKMNIKFKFGKPEALHPPNYSEGSGMNKLDELKAKAVRYLSHDDLVDDIESLRPYVEIAEILANTRSPLYYMNAQEATQIGMLLQKIKEAK